MIHSGKAFFVNKPGIAIFNMGNWDGALNAGLKFSFYGDVYAKPAADPAGQGQEGRIQAQKFCFNTGNSPDCIASWPTGGAGLYIKIVGNTMSGPLMIGLKTQIAGIIVSGGVSGSNFSGSTVGIDAASDSYAVRCPSNDINSWFEQSFIHASSYACLWFIYK